MAKCVKENCHDEGRFKLYGLKGKVCRLHSAIGEREQSCGCRYSSLTFLTTHWCDTHQKVVDRINEMLPNKSKMKPAKVPAA